MYKSVNKSVKRTLSLALVLMILFLSGSHTLASASAVDAKEIPISKAYSFSGKDVSAQMTQSLQKLGVAVDENTLLEVRPSSTGTGATELHVTQIDGNVVTDAVLLAFDENGEQISIAVETASGSEVSTGNAYDLELYDGGVVINYSVQYIIYLQYYGSSLYIRPRAAMLDFYTDGTHEVEYLKFEYHCNGVEYTYPGFQDCGNGPFGYCHVIAIEDYDPIESYYYFKLEPSENIINISSGTINLGQSVSYEFDIDGRTYLSGHAVPLPYSYS